MDACHFFLGRPWQYDKKLCMMVARIIIVLSRMVLRLYWPRLDQRAALNLWKRKEMFCSLNLKFWRNWKALKKGNFHLMCEANKEQHDHLIIVQSLLQEFSNVVPEEIRTSLPPWVFNIALTSFLVLVFLIRQSIEWVQGSMKSCSNQSKSWWLKTLLRKPRVLVLSLPNFFRRRIGHSICMLIVELLTKSPLVTAI